MTATLERQAQNAAIREWAQANGWELGDRGRIAAEIRDAYAARGDAPGDELQNGAGDPGGAQWPELSAAMDDDFTDFTDEPPAEPAAPLTLEEARARSTVDDNPAHTARRRGGRARRAPKPESAPAPRVTAAVSRDIEGKVAFWLGISAEPWALVDPYCGGALLEAVPDLARGWTPILCQSPAVVKYLSKSSTFMLWTNALMSTRPVVEAVIAHHVTKRVVLDKEGKPEPAAAPDFSQYATQGRQSDVAVPAA